MSLKHAVLGFLSVTPIDGLRPAQAHGGVGRALLAGRPGADLSHARAPRGGRAGVPVRRSRRRASPTGASTRSPTPGWPSLTPGSRHPSSTCRRGRCSWCGCSSSAGSAPTASAPSWRSAPRRPASSLGPRADRRGRAAGGRGPRSRDAPAPRDPRQRARARARRARVGAGPACRADRLSHLERTDRHPAAGRCPTPEGVSTVSHDRHRHAQAGHPAVRAGLRRRRPRPVHARRRRHGVVPRPGDERRRSPVRHEPSAPGGRSAHDRARGLGRRRPAPRPRARLVRRRAAAVPRAVRGPDRARCTSRRRAPGARVRPSGSPSCSPPGWSPA